MKLRRREPDPDLVRFGEAVDRLKAAVRAELEPLANRVASMLSKLLSRRRD